jgi:hypothetical protein
MVINIIEWCRPDGGPVLNALRKVLSYRVSIGELVVVALVLGTPYLIVGVIWSSIHTDHLAEMDGIDLVVSFLGAIVSWPVLLIANVCMT